MDDDGSLLDIFSCPCCKPGNMSAYKHKTSEAERERTKLIDKNKRLKPYGVTK